MQKFEKVEIVMEFMKRHAEKVEQLEDETIDNLLEAIQSDYKFRDDDYFNLPFYKETMEQLNNLTIIKK